MKKQSEPVLTNHDRLVIFAFLIAFYLLGLAYRQIQRCNKSYTIKNEVSNYEY